MSMQNSIIVAYTTAVIVLTKKFIPMYLGFYFIVILYYRSTLFILLVLSKNLLAA